MRENAGRVPFQRWRLSKDGGNSNRTKQPQVSRLCRDEFRPELQRRLNILGESVVPTSWNGTSACGMARRTIFAGYASFSTTTLREAAMS
jgi:hypothetical protein